MGKEKRYMEKKTANIKNIMNEILIFIPARLGSKRIKDKNIRKIKGKPLIYWTIRYAKKFLKSNKDIIVSR